MCVPESCRTFRWSLSCDGVGGWVRNSSEAGQLCSSLMTIKCSAVFSYVLRDPAGGRGGRYSEDEPVEHGREERILASSAAPRSQMHPEPPLPCSKPVHFNRGSSDED